MASNAHPHRPAETGAYADPIQRPSELSHADLERYMRRGRRMRAEAFAEIMTELGAFIHDLFVRKPAPAADQSADAQPRAEAPLAGRPASTV